MPVSSYVENMQQTCVHPFAGPGFLVESKRQNTRSERLSVGRLSSQSAWYRVYPNAIYPLKLGIGLEKREEMTEEICSLFLVLTSWRYFTICTPRLRVLW